MSLNAATRASANYQAGVDENWVVIWGGANDIAAYNETALDTYGYLTTTVAAWQAAGYKVAVLTLIPGNFFAGSELTERAAFNAAVLANTAGADVIVDVASDSRLSTITSTYYAYDNDHLNNVGYAVIAELVQAAILNG